MAYNESCLMPTEDPPDYLRRAEQSLKEKEREVGVIRETVAWLVNRSEDEIAGERARIRDLINSCEDRVSMARQRLWVLDIANSPAVVNTCPEVLEGPSPGKSEIQF